MIIIICGSGGGGVGHGGSYITMTLTTLTSDIEPIILMWFYSIPFSCSVVSAYTTAKGTLYVLCTVYKVFIRMRCLFSCHIARIRIRFRIIIRVSTRIYVCRFVHSFCFFYFLFGSVQDTHIVRNGSDANLTKQLQSIFIKRRGGIDGDPCVIYYIITACWFCIKDTDTEYACKSTIAVYIHLR